MNKLLNIYILKTWETIHDRGSFRANETEEIFYDIAKLKQRVNELSYGTEYEVYEGTLQEIKLW